VIAAGELLLAAGAGGRRQAHVPVLRQGLRILPARFGVEAGMIGAAALAYAGLAELEEEIA